MADIVALAGKRVTVTMGGTTVRLTRGRIRIGNTVMQFATTGQTPDADDQYWMNSLSGLNSWDLEADGYIDYAATAANRLQGDNIKFRPGTSGSGTLAVLLAAGLGFGGTGVVETAEPGWDAEGNKPNSFKVTMKGDGALTYLNS